MDNRYLLTDPWLLQPLPHYGQLTARDYAELGFKVGLEIHQQLMTERKLFCRCPAGQYNQGEHQAEVLRHMRPTLSEMGEYDGTALMEFKTRKDIIYHLNKNTVCTYEMDDAPPFEIDDVALDRSIAMAMLLGCNVVGEVHITRKQYLDGSIPTGFQRTAIIGTDADIPFRDRQVHIRQISLEEDSCREVSDRGHVRVFRTDRLGMPLIETVTDPDMVTPEEAMAVGQVLRHLCRISGLVRTGSGAARQDVNVSVTGGTRIEIKGVPSLRAIPLLTHNEALRQRALVGIRGELARRGITDQDIPDQGRDVTSLVKGSDCIYVRKAVDQGAVVMAIALPGFQGLLEVQTQPRTRFLKEFSDRIRVIACIDDLPNLALSTQEVPTLSSGEWARVCKACRVDHDVPVLLIWGPARDVQTAVKEMAIRAREALQGVPKETRQALDDGTNGFERILPGADRMYPDTDLPPIGLADERLDRIRVSVPEATWRRFARLRELGVGMDLAQRLSRHRAYTLFEALHPQIQQIQQIQQVQPHPAAGLAPLGANGLASLLLDRSCPRPASLGAAGPWWEEVVGRICRREILAEAVWSSEEQIPAPMTEKEGRAVFDETLETLADELADKLPEDPAKRQHAVMGLVMPRLRGRICGRTVRDWVAAGIADANSKEGRP